MDTAQWITLAVLGVSMALFLSDRLRPDLVALLAALALGLSGVLTPQETLSGFSRQPVITILAIFILAEALRRAGVAERAARVLMQVGQGREAWLVIATMVGGVLFSLFMNNIAAAAILLPAVTATARRADISPSRLLMPMAFGTILGGMATLLTSANIVVSGVLQEGGYRGYGLLDFAALGLPLALLGVLYMAIWGRRLLPRVPALEHLLGAGENAHDLPAIYRMEERLVRGRVGQDSPLVGRTVEESALRERHRLSLVSVERNGRRIYSITPELTFKPGDVLLLEGRPEDFNRPQVRKLVELLPFEDIPEEELESGDYTLLEAVLAPRSELIGQTLRATHFREKFRMNVLAIWRAGEPYRTGLSDMRLQFGDALLLHGPRKQIPILAGARDLLLLVNGEHAPPVRGKGGLAALILLITLGAAAFTPQALGQVMLTGALAMVLARILSMEAAIQAVDFKVVFLVAGMLPMSLAMSKSGVASMLADGMIGLVGPLGSLGLLAGFIALAALLAQVVTGAAVAGIVAPIAIHAAQQAGLDPRSVAMGVALATSMTFITPLGHPVNMLVVGPGGYRFRDYVRVGLPLALLIFAAILLLLPRIWPLF
jgi:di/tricarboxylate transporter